MNKQNFIDDFDAMYLITPLRLRMTHSHILIYNKYKKEIKFLIFG